MYHGICLFFYDPIIFYEEKKSIFKLKLIYYICDIIDVSVYQ